MFALTPIALGWLLFGEPEAQLDASADYRAAVAELEALNLAVNRSPDEHPALARAIERVTEFADELAHDEQARELRTLALLNLARARLRADDEEGAGQAIDEAIRAAGDAEVPARSFGPTLADFYAKRLGALEEWGQGAIQVECSVACRVLIDEREVEASASELDFNTSELEAGASELDFNTSELYFGTYRVWIASEDERVEGLAIARHEVIIDIDGEVETITYAPALIPEPEPEPIPEPPPVVAPKRLLPRWAELATLVAGAGLIITGGALLSQDGKCIGGGGLDPMTDAQRCPQLWESTAGGAASLALGAALAVTGGVMLAVDEVRVNGNKGTRAVLTWTLRF